MYQLMGNEQTLTISSALEHNFWIVKRGLEQTINRPESLRMTFR